MWDCKYRFWQGATMAQDANSAAYSYLANSSLVGQIVFTSNTVARMTTTKQYDYLNRLGSISSTPSNSFAYLYNEANQRTMAQLWDGSYWRYGYDALGQVISGSKYWPTETPARPVRYETILLCLRPAKPNRQTDVRRSGERSSRTIAAASSGRSTFDSQAPSVGIDLL
jgi:hypothetical protein